MVGKMLETPDILGLQGSEGSPLFSCQHFPIGAKSEQLFLQKIRKVLKFPYIEDKPEDFWQGCNCLSLLHSTLASSYLMNK